MSEKNNGELIQAQNQVIGILFEIIKRLQSNNDLDEEYFQIIESKKSAKKKKRLEKILNERKENAKIVNRLLKQLEIGD
ncbi:MAG: hydrolase [Thaumarchaeota archaeon]|nr:hydrolase [Nitrososphaerota archaeon]